MSNRFEKIIAVGIAAGALTLAGCGSSGGGGNGDGNGDGNTEPSTVEFLGGRTISPTEIELQFSDAVTLGDAAAAPSLFTLSENRLNFGVHSFYTTSGGPLTGKNVIAMASFQLEGTLHASAYYSFTSPSDLGDVQTVVADGDVVTLTLATPILSGADDDTGMLRLTYTPGADGLLDADGDQIAEITLGVEDRGNVADTVEGELPGPVLIGARTIDATHVELIFNEPVVIANPANALGSFALVNNNPLARVPFAGDDVGFFPNPTDSTGAEWMALNPPFSWDIYSATYDLFFSYDSTSVPQVSIADIAVDGSRADRLILTLGGAIPADADGGTGRLRLYYTDIMDGIGGIEDADANPMATFGYGQLHRGNVEDTIE